jgi:Ca2+-binding RTX toxin-like protein
VALNVTDIGINLTGIRYWSTEEPFIDRFKTASDWSATNSSGGDATSSLKINTLGYITNPGDVAGISVMVGVDPRSAAPTDRYVLTYDGSATVKVLSSTIISQSPGKVVFEYTGRDTNPDVLVNFQGLSNSSPLSNVHIVREDQVSLFNSGEIFNPDFIAKVSQWGVVRTMDWQNTNDSLSVTWSNRTTLNDASWSSATTNDGVPLEALVKLANEAHVDLWYNVPTRADNTYVTNAMTYIRDHLDPSLKVHVEWSNEVWNASFAANSYAQGKANALWGGGSSVAHGANIYYGYRSAQIADIAHKVFTGTHAGQVVDVLAGQAANSGLMTYMLEGVAKAGLGSASSLFQDYAIAPYFGQELSRAGSNSADRTIVLDWANSGSAGLDAAFHELEYGGSLSTNYSLATMHKWFANAASAASSAGLNLVTYEGGASLYTSNYGSTYRATAQDFFGRLINDPRMGELYTKLIADFKASGGTEFLAFNDVSGNATSGYWGALDSIYDTTSPRYEALLAARDSNTGVSQVPTVGNDTLVATVQGGTLDALAGNDVITAGSGNDTIIGSDGNDKIIGSSGSTDSSGKLIEKDYYQGGDGSDTIVGGDGNDAIWGNLPGSSTGPDGGDSVDGGAGNDSIHGNLGADTIDGGNGNDVIYGDNDNDSIVGGSGSDNLQGGAANDTLAGGIGDDTVSGGSNNDVVTGDDGNDLLLGGSGRDVITGGAGADIFSFRMNEATFATSGGSAYLTDEVTDFVSGTDHISLSFHPVQVLQGTASSVEAAVSWAAQALQGHAGVADVAAVSVGTDAYLFYDDSGQGGALDSGIRLDNVTGIAAADFV